MTKTEYLKKMEKYLKRLPREDYRSAMDYFTEYFDDIGDENTEQAIRDLGTPKEAASEILNSLLEKKLAEQEPHPKKSRGRHIVTISLLAVLAAPIGIPLLIAAFAVILAGIVVIYALLISGFICSAAAIILAAKILLRGILAYAASVPGGIMLTGLAVLSLGIAVFLGGLSLFLTSISGRGILFIIRKITGSVKNHTKGGSRL